MRIIYEDGNYRDERLSQSEKTDGFVDISSMSEEMKREAERENAKDRPYRPTATLRPAEEVPVQTAQQPAVTAQPQQMYAPVQYPQGYNGNQPVYYQYPAGYPMPYQQAPYQPVQQYPQMPVQYPAPQQYQPQTAYTAPAPVAAPVAPAPKAQTTGEYNAGTRVVYQSPDFDKAESVAPASAGQYSAPAPVQMPAFTQEEVAVQLPYVRPVGSVPMPDKKFEVDDMEMSMFELNSMAHKYQSKSKNFRRSSDLASLEVEDCDDEEEIPLQTNKEFNLFDDDDDDDEPVKKAPKKTAKKKKSKKGKKRSEMIRRTVLAVSVVAIIVSCFYLYNEFRLSQMNARVTEETNDLIIDLDELYGEYEAVPDEGSSDEVQQPHELTEEEKQEVVRQKWAEIKAKYPDVDFPSNLQLEYAKLYATNQDFVGYLQADGIGMKLPVVQTTNDDYYLKKDFYGNNTKYGTPFVTHLNTISEEKYGLDTNTVIFGHHMNDGSVFGILDKYKTIEGFKAAPVITFNTMYHNYQWKVIAAFVTNAEESDDNGYVFKYYFTDLSSEDRFAAYLNALSERSLYNTGVDVLPTDKILTLSTCSHEFDNARFVVVARLVRNGEVAEVDVSKATVNSNPRYPQAYYDKKKQTNPYKDAYRWEVG